MSLPKDPADKNKLFSRRFFLKQVIGGGILGLLGATVFAVLRYLWPPQGTRDSVTSVVAAKVGELAANTAKMFRFRAKPGILSKTPQGQLKAFSAVCTHLGCTVQYEAETSVIWCPCHNGKFDLNGQVISGPPPKPLQAFAANVQGEEIVVSKIS